MKNKILQVFLFGYLIILFCSSCDNNKKKDIKVLKNNDISIKFINTPIFNDSLKLGKNNFLILNAPFISYRTNTDFFPEKVDIDNNENIKEDTIFLRLRYQFDKFETFMFFKGDSVLIDYVNNQPKPKVLNRAVKEYDYNLISFFNNYSKPLDDISFLKTNQRLRNKEELKDYEKSIKDYYKKSNQLLDSLKSINLISNYTFEHKKKEIYYSSIKESSLLKTVIKDSSDLHIDSYRGTLLNFAKKLVNPKSIKGANGYIFNSKKAFDIVAESDLFHEKSKAFLLWNYIKDVGNNFSINDFQDRHIIFNQIVGNKKLIEDVNKELLVDFLDIKSKTNDVFVLNHDKKQTSLNKIIEKHKGKVVFIDFWASWCAPCRKAMPDSKKLIKEYENKEIVFLFMSIDKKFKDWENAQKREQLLTYEHSNLIINYPSAFFFKELNLKDIPRYIIFNKKGELVHKNSPSPSSENIRNILDEYLSE